MCKEAEGLTKTHKNSDDESDSRVIVGKVEIERDQWGNTWNGG